MTAQRVAGVGVARQQADAHAGVHKELDPVELEGRGQRVDQPPADDLGVFARPCGVTRLAVWEQVPDQEGELVAADPGQQLVRAHGPLEALRDLLQELVPDLVAKAVVDQLEVVQVDEQQGRGAAAALRLLTGPLELVEQAAPAAQAGELVPVGDRLGVGERPPGGVGGNGGSHLFLIGTTEMALECPGWIPPAGFEPAISALKGRRPDR